MLKVVHDECEPNATCAAGAVSSSLLDEIVRDGARQMLAAALSAEVAAYIEAHRHEVDGNAHRLVVRNGYHAEREAAAGAVPVRQPRVNDRRVDPISGERQRFSSAILPAWARKSAKVGEVLPLLYLHGLSTSDFAATVPRRNRGPPDPHPRPLTAPAIPGPTKEHQQGKAGAGQQITHDHSHPPAVAPHRTGSHSPEITDPRIEAKPESAEPI